MGRHPTTLMDRPAHRRTSLATHLDEILSFLVLRLMRYLRLETYVLECWILMFISEHVGNAVRTCSIYGLCEICDVYVISVKIM
jgi:hypothetical protein